MFNNHKLNASTHDTNITITRLHSNVTINGTEWMLSHNKHTAFDLKVHIEYGLGAHNDARVFMNIQSNVNNRNTESLLLAISANNTEYISMIIGVNNTHNNKIYPGCGGDTGYGNIEYISNNSSYPTRIEQITNGGNLSTLSNMNQAQLSNGRENTWPIRWNFDNHPDCIDNGIDYNSCGNDLLFSFTSIDSLIQSCNFGNALPSNAGLDIFIGVANPGETLSITEIEIGYSYKATWSPTMKPTANPTIHPTINPTIYPTIYPTLEVINDTKLGYNYIENVSVMIEVETDLNLTTNSSVIQEIVNVLLTQLIANSNWSILAIPIIRIKEINGGYVIAVIIEIKSDVDIDLDDDLINDINVELEGEVIDDVIIKNVIIDNIENKYDTEKQEVINYESIVIWCILGGIMCIALFLIIMSKCGDNTSYSVLNGVCFMISVINLMTNGIVLFYCMQCYYLTNTVQHFTYFLIVYGILLFVVLPYIINIIFGIKHCCMSREHRFLTICCVIISGDTYYSMIIIHGLLLKQIKIITLILQNVPQIVLQSLFFGWIVQKIDIMFIISICCSFISCLTCFVCNNVKRIGFKRYGVKIIFNVSSDKEARNIKKNFKGNRDRLRKELALILMVKNNNIKIDGVSVNGVNIEIDVIHEISTDIKNNIDNLYENEMNKICKLLKKTFDLISDIEVKVINDRSQVFMTVNSTSIITSISDGTPATESPHSDIELVTPTGIGECDIVTLRVPDPPKLIETITVSSEGIIEDVDMNRNERENSDDDMYLNENNNNIFTDDGGKSVEEDNNNNNKETNNGATNGYIGQYIQYEDDIGIDV